MDYSYISENIKQIRLSRELSQEAISELIDENRSSYAGWERGIIPRADIVVKLVNAYQISFDEILSINKALNLQKHQAKYQPQEPDSFILNDPFILKEKLIESLTNENKLLREKVNELEKQLGIEQNAPGKKAGKTG